MWIRTAIKLPHDPDVCQKTVGDLAGDFLRGWWEKNTDFLDSGGNEITD